MNNMYSNNPNSLFFRDYTPQNKRIKIIKLTCSQSKCKHYKEGYENNCVYYADLKKCPNYKEKEN